MGEVFFQGGEQFGVGSVGAAVVVDDEFVVFGVFCCGVCGCGGVGGLRAVAIVVVVIGEDIVGVIVVFVGVDFIVGWGEDFFTWIGAVTVSVSMRVFEAADEEFSTKSDVYAHVAVHGVFGEEIDAEFFAGFGEAELAVECEDVGEETATLVVVDEVEESFGHCWGGRGEGSVFGGAVEVIDTGVLVVKSAVEDSASDGVVGKHACHEWLELDITMIEF